MNSYLSEYTDSRDNNFNLVRFIAASLVLYTHSYVLTTGIESSQPLKNSLGITWGDISVDVFFITSGFLITRSFFRKKNLTSFIFSRILRIYPALIVSTLFCVFIVGLAFTSHSKLSYLSNHQTYKYLFHNITLFFGVNYDLPGVFEDTPYKYAVNGSLWTLPFEVKMYTYLVIINLIIVFLQRIIEKKILQTTFFSIAFIAITLNIINHFGLFFPKNTTNLFAMFFIGSALYVFKDKIYLSSIYFFSIILIIFIFIQNKNLFFLMYCISIPYITIYLAYIPKGIIRKFNNYGDYSYGIYIYAFPIQQSIIALNPDTTVLTMIIKSFLLTLFFSYLSWHIIENNFLKVKYYKFRKNTI
jgi:peptidoglycan/LPS O-acetylase OafA/YrhL